MGDEGKQGIDEILKKLDVLASQTNVAFVQVNDKIKRLEIVQANNNSFNVHVGNGQARHAPPPDLPMKAD